MKLIFVTKEGNKQEHENIIRVRYNLKTKEIHYIKQDNSQNLLYPYITRAPRNTEYIIFEDLEALEDKEIAPALPGKAEK